LIITDAGSTGSRVLAFTFYENPVTGNLLLVDELWKEGFQLVIVFYVI